MLSKEKYQRNLEKIENKVSLSSISPTLTLLLP